MHYIEATDANISSFRQRRFLFYLLSFLRILVLNNRIIVAFPSRREICYLLRNTRNYDWRGRARKKGISIAFVCRIEDKELYAWCKEKASFQKKNKFSSVFFFPHTRFLCNTNFIIFTILYSSVTMRGIKMGCYILEQRAGCNCWKVVFFIWIFNLFISQCMHYFRSVIFYVFLGTLGDLTFVKC